ncbi:hypothetical protein OAT47_01695 [Gammaproteobacteria bacterium]|nr:hypothetical protein [Gammaproteobacteria bacterium]
MECGCGRSPTGKCIGWHKLSEEEYQNKLEEYQKRKKKKTKEMKISYQLVLLGLFSFCVGVYLYIAVSS